MATVRDRRAMSERAPMTFKHPPPAREFNVYVITQTRTTAKIDPETGESVANTVTEAHIEADEGTVTRMLELKKAGDERLANHRAFRLAVAPNGKPTIGSERRA